ncbi:MAG: rhodanese-like domain-containing protein [Bryocella sp.]
MELEITVEQARDRLASDEKPMLLDVREAWEIATAGLDGSTNIPMQEVPARAFNELDEETPILVMCHHGARSLSVAAWLQNQGFTKAQSVAGGMDAWSRNIDPTVPRY